MPVHEFDELLKALSPQQLALINAIGAVFLILLVAGLLIDIALALIALKRTFSRAPLPTAMHELRALPWTMMDLGLLTCLVLGLLAVTAEMPAATGSQPGTLAESGFVLRTILLPVGELFVVAGFLVYKRMSLGRAFGILFSRLHVNLLQAVLALLGLMPLIVAAFAVSTALLMWLQYPIHQQPLVLIFCDPRLPAWLIVYISILAAVVAPLTEEIVFRGIALPALLKHVRPGLAVGFVSLIFACAHFHLPTLTPLFVLAAGFSAAYIVTGSLAVPILMHAMFNISTMALMLALRGTGLIQ